MSEASLPGQGQGDDFDMDADMARFLDDVDAGRENIPEPDERGAAVMFSLGEVDPAVLAAAGGPDGLDAVIFAQDGAAEQLAPGPVLCALAEQAAAATGTLTDNQLLGALSAARKLANRAAYLETVTIAEFARRRRAQLEAALARQAPPGHREGEHADAELAFHLTASINAAGEQMDIATALATRLPATLAAMAAGTIDPGRAYYVWYYTRFLSDDDAAHADAILASAAPDLRHDQLARKAAALEIKLDPAAARARKEHARKDGRRVEARREASGNMSYGGRELSVEEGLAVKAAVEADADALRRAGLAGTLRELRLLCFLDRLTGRNPLDRVTQAADQDDVSTDHPPGGAADPGGSPAPLPALINLTVPAGNLFGWSTTPGDAGAWGLLDPDDTRALVRAASQHPRTRWCLTVTGSDGTAVAHGCARGPHRWTPHPGTTTPDRTRAGPDPPQQQQLAQLLRALNITLTPIAQGRCDHSQREDRYTPSRALQHLVRARTTRCPAPGCGAQAYHTDQDHTIPYPQGPTDQCNLAPPCRRHHRCKQALGWKLKQPEPGVMKWTLPSGRVYTTTPTVYDT
jgi:hypothetical protein